MSHTAREIAARALDLPEEERLALATELIDSVEGHADPEWEQAWLEELARRRLTAPRTQSRGARCGLASCGS